VCADFYLSNKLMRWLEALATISTLQYVVAAKMRAWFQSQQRACLCTSRGRADGSRRHRRSDNLDSLHHGHSSPEPYLQPSHALPQPPGPEPLRPNYHRTTMRPSCISSLGEHLISSSAATASGSAIKHDCVIFKVYVGYRPGICIKRRSLRTFPRLFSRTAAGAVSFS
jgi:hypothetical protein